MDSAEGIKQTIKEAAKEYKEKLQRLKEAVKESKQSRQKQTGQ